MDGWTRNTTSTLIVEIKPSRVATQRLADGETPCTICAWTDRWWTGQGRQTEERNSMEFLKNPIPKSQFTGHCNTFYKKHNKPRPSPCLSSLLMDRGWMDCGEGGGYIQNNGRAE